jgi:hypothetical protein
MDRSARAQSDREEGSAMSAESTFKARFPGAAAERHRTNGGRIYWLIRRQRGDYVPYAEGDTKAKAWTCAVAKLEAEKTAEGSTSP